MEEALMMGYAEFMWVLFLVAGGMAVAGIGL